MDGVQKLVKNELKEPLKQMGFKTRKFNFYRQVHGVVQGFKIYAYGHYTIRYNMFPLIHGRAFDPYIFEGNEIADITVPKRETFLNVIPYGENVTEEDMIHAWANRYDKYKAFAEQLVEEVHKYLLPLFEAYSFPEKHIESCEWEGDVPFVYASRAEWCLQARKFDLAYFYLEKMMAEEINHMNTCHVEKMLWYKSYFDRNDMAGLEEHLREKEIITLKSFGLK